MTIKDLFLLDAKKSNIEEFFALLYGQKIHYSFLVYSVLPIDFSRIEKLNVYQVESDDKFYFLLYYFNQPFLVFEMDVESSNIKNVFCINREIYRESIMYISSNLFLSDVPFVDRNSRMT
jgi:hypothetical protein